MTDKERTWCNHAINGGSFVAAFAKACLYADDGNFKLLQPVLAQMMDKYPSYSKERP